MGQKSVYVTPDIITELLKTGSETRARCIQGLPNDARIAAYAPGVKWEGDKVIAFQIIFESEEWEPVAADEVPPTFDVIFERI